MTSSVLTSKEKEVVSRLVDRIIKYDMSAPAIFFLESYKPMSFIGSQVMLAFQPVVKLIYSFESFDVIQNILEKREGVEYILREIEKRERERSRKSTKKQDTSKDDKSET